MGEFELSAELAHAPDADIAEALKHANPLVLRGLLYQLTGVRRYQRANCHKTRSQTLPSFPDRPGKRRPPPIGSSPRAADAPQHDGDAATPSDRTSRTDDERVEQVLLLPPPEHLIRFFPIQGTAVEALVADTRSRIRDILRGTDDRLLVVVGPCSIHDPGTALDYARRLAVERERAADTLEIVMRVYFEKPRTTVGWKGLINDPYLDESCRISEGLRIARQLLIDIGRLGVPSGSELLDTISPQYIGDLIAWGSIGARTTESQVHRELASGSSAPIGFKNGTDGDVKVACDAILAASRPHHFLGVHKSGQVAMIRTRGNPDCHIVLRGGQEPNYDAASVAAACEALERAGLAPSLMVDCSHANCGKRHEKQLDVVREIDRQLQSGPRRIFGVMLESHIHAGAQPFTPGRDDPARLARGVSITDPCLGWDDNDVTRALICLSCKSISYIVFTKTEIID